VPGTFASREPDGSEVDNGREGVVTLFTGVDGLDRGIGKASGNVIYHRYDGHYGLIGPAA
jgi:hypothetical protein